MLISLQETKYDILLLLLLRCYNLLSWSLSNNNNNNNK